RLQSEFSRHPRGVIRKGPAEPRPRRAPPGGTAQTGAELARDRRRAEPVARGGPEEARAGRRAGGEGPGLRLRWTMGEAASSVNGELVDRLRDDQRDRRRRGERRVVEDYLRAHPALAGDAEALLDLIYHERKLDQEDGSAAEVEEYLGRFPHLRG